MVFPLIPEPNLLRGIWDTSASKQLGTFTYQNWEKIKDGLKRLRDIRVSTLAEP